MRTAGLSAALIAATVGLATAGGAVSAAVAVTAHAGAHSRPPRGQGIDVLPFPGTPDAAPGTHIDFPAVALVQMRSVRAVGSRSGMHAGHLSAEPAGLGTAFSPDRPFAPGEHVSVDATFRSVAAGTASGAPGRTQVSFSFSVANGASGGNPGPGADSGAPAAPRTTRASAPLTHTFVTEPRFKPPVVTMSGKGIDAAAGDVFLDAQGSGQNAAYILNPRGDLLWYHPAATKGRGLGIREVRVQSYDGEPALTYWQGREVKPPGAGRGMDVILNEHYQTIRTVTAGNGFRDQGADSHEFLLGHEGSQPTAFITIFSPTEADLTSVGGPPRGPAYDWIIQEIDIATGKVIWEWHALGHVPLISSYTPFFPAVRYDYFHLNSVQQLPDGNILISSRNTWAVYLIDKKTGKILWKLGGKHSSFKMGPHTSFEWQHDAVLHDNGLVTLFDDGATPREESQSRALELHISTATHQATLVHAFTHSPPTLATAQGSVQLLANRNVFVGWGREPYFSEYTPSGKQIFGGSFRWPVESQRAYRSNDWIGSPLGRPAIAVRRSAMAGRDLVYASWNGATRLKKWQVLTSARRSGPFAMLGSPTAWYGFETRIQTARAPYFELEALDSQGHVLGTSAVAVGR